MLSSTQSSSFVNRVLGAGVEPAHLAAPEPKSGVSAIPPPDLGLSVEANPPSVTFKHVDGLPHPCSVVI